MSISRGRYVAKFCRPNESYTGRPIPESGRCNTTSFWMVVIHNRRQGSSIQIPGPSFGVFADFEQAKAWAIQRLNELVAQEQDNAGIQVQGERVHNLHNVEWRALADQQNR